MIGGSAAPSTSAIGSEQPVERAFDLLASVGGEVDQQVAAEDQVVGRRPRGKAGIEQVAPGKPDLLANCRVDYRTASVFVEPTTAEIQVGVAKCVRRIAACSGTVEAGMAHIEGIDGKGLRRQPCIEEPHGNRVGLLSTGMAR